MTGPPQLSVESLRQELYNDQIPQNSASQANVMLQLFQIARNGNLEAFHALEEQAILSENKFACGYVAVLLTSDKVSGVTKDTGRAEGLMLTIVSWLTEQAEEDIETFRHVQFFLVCSDIDNIYYHHHALMNVLCVYVVCMLLYLCFLVFCFISDHLFDYLVYCIVGILLQRRIWYDFMS